MADELIHHHEEEIPMTTPDADVDIAILGAGPIGVEAALYGLQQGRDLVLLERDVPGAHLERWAHVELFSPWEMNRSPWGARHLRETGYDLSPPDSHPTGKTFRRGYLLPLCDTSPVGEHLRTGCEVREVARQSSLKPEDIGSPERAAEPFVLRLRDDGDEEYLRANTVIDTTGAYETPNGLGPGGMRAIGEPDYADRIEYDIPDALGTERHTYSGRHTLVVGDGHSAVTTLRALHRLQQDAPDTEITWLRRPGGRPYEVRDDDPLPMRRKLAKFGNRFAKGNGEGIDALTGGITAIRAGDGTALDVELQRNGDRETRTFDRVVANVGHRPDLSIVRELQYHTCYATEGPIDLAASLLADSSADCLDQSTGGVDLLKTPEPNFFVLGSKSYGRNSQFLLQIGFEQIQQVFDEALDDV